LIDSHKQSPALVEPNPFKNIIVHMPYWSGTEFVAGLNYTFTKIEPLHAYAVMLYSGKISHQKKAERAFVLPVRSIN